MANVSTPQVICTEHVTTAATNLGGALPNGTSATSYRLVKITDCTTGGLFIWGTELTFVDQIRVHLAGGTSVTVKIVGTDGEKLTIYSAAALANVDVILTGSWRLMSGEKIEVITAGAAGAEKARARVYHKPLAPKE